MKSMPPSVATMALVRIFPMDNWLTGPVVVKRSSHTYQPIVLYLNKEDEKMVQLNSLQG